MSGRAGKKPATPRGLAGPKAEKTVALALQGGGAHGAFTWGVLDQLLEDGRLAIEAVTGASAGAMNAVVLLEGWSRDGPEGAREQLRKFWKRVSLDGVLSPIQRTLFDQFLGFWSADGTPAHLWLNAWSQAASPYELNPLDINPLRELLDEFVDFAALRERSPMPILVAATKVRTGECRVFREHELTAEAVLASACLPQLFQAVEIDGEAYWDGGYTSNPPVLELAKLGRGRTLLVVRINPADGEGSPRSAPAIRDRTAEIVFGRPLAVELAQLEKLRDLGHGLLGSLQPRLRRLARLEVQVIDGDETLARLDPLTKVAPDARLLEHLRAEGRAAAEAWLRRRARLTARGPVPWASRQEARQHL
jgi:NTE family protein